MNKIVFVLFSVIKSYGINFPLIISLTSRNLFQNYKNSLLGIIWIVIQPVIFILIYTLVFKYIFKVKFTGLNFEFDFIPLFISGLMIFNLFSDALNKSCSIISEHASYAKKFSFPLEILPLQILLMSLFNFVIMFLLMVGYIFFFHQSLIDFYFILRVFKSLISLIPFIFLTLGFSYFISSFAVILKDIKFLIPTIMSMLFFLTPIFYSIDIIPSDLQPFFKLNPLVVPIDNFRYFMFDLGSINWLSTLFNSLLSFVVFIFGILLFEKLRENFAELL